jgi:hypothetical protein
MLLIGPVGGDIVRDSVIRFCKGGFLLEEARRADTENVYVLQVTRVSHLLKDELILLPSTGAFNQSLVQDARHVCQSAGFMVLRLKKPD